MKRFLLIGLLLLIAVLASGCSVTRYDVRPETKSAILLEKQTKEVALTLKYYDSSILRPLISREENTKPDAEQIVAGKKFFSFVKEELGRRGFVASSNAKIGIEVGFAYRKGIILITAGSIASRWKVSYGNTASIFDIADFKLLSVMGGGSFTEEKARELAKSMAEEFIKELKE
ncbi:MAG TPA: hypothetical protein DHW81_01800 [Nitrospiraceae bacterium]|nr:hypothetical protein [Nitrospiraceae bacterium]